MIKKAILYYLAVVVIGSTVCRSKNNYLSIFLHSLQSQCQLQKKFAYFSQSWSMLGVNFLDECRTDIILCSDLTGWLGCHSSCGPTGPMYFVLCRLYPSLPLSHHGSVWLLPTEYIFYCKRAILFLSSSKILTPHPPLRPASVYPRPRLCCAGRIVISLLLVLTIVNTPYRGCGLAYPYDQRGFMGAKKKTSVGIVVLIP